MDFTKVLEGSLRKSNLKSMCVEKFFFGIFYFPEIFFSGKKLFPENIFFKISKIFMKKELFLKYFLFLLNFVPFKKLSLRKFVCVI